MTIAIALKVGDGIVLGADSASTLFGKANEPINVYFNGDKVFNLRKGLPIGMVTAGLGNLDNRSISSLAKDLRVRFTDVADAWHLNESAYTIEEVAHRVADHFFEAHYKNEWPKKREMDDGTEVDVYPVLSFLIGGYSGGKKEGEIWQANVDQTGKFTVTSIFDLGAFGVSYIGQTEAVARLMNGWSPKIAAGLVESGVPEEEAGSFLAGQQSEMEPLVQVSMPIKDGIDLVRYLIEVTAGFVQFTPGAPSVHDPIDLAAITPHEGYRWARRKHYFSNELNPVHAAG